MRVLHVYKTYYPNTYGGIEQVIYQLCQGCARRGIAADVFTFSPDKNTGPVAYEQHQVIYNKQLIEIASTPFSLGALKRFNKIKDNYDIINYHFPFPFMDMLHLMAHPKAKTVVTYHSDIVKQKRLMKLYQPLQEQFLSSVDCIVASSPNYVASSQTLQKYLDKTETLDEQTLEEVLEDEKQIPVDICNHALLVGFGRVGSLLGEKLMAQGIPLVVIETSRTRVDELRARGIRAVLGNAANEEIMNLAHLDCARWLLLTIPNGYEAGEIVASAREKCPNIEIIARAHYDDEVEYIVERGANQVVMGEREIARAMLKLLETPPAGELITG